MDEIPGRGENETVEELVKVTESRQTVEEQTQLRLHGYKKYARCET